MECADLASDGIFLNTVRRYVAGVEPMWLIRAKRLHDELGRFIYVLSQQNQMELPQEILREAETYVRAFVQSLPSQNEHGRLDAMTLLAIVQIVATRHESIRPPLDAGQRPAETACFLYSLHDPEIAAQLAEHVNEVELLLERWGDETPRRPTKWQVAARLWEKATGRSYSSDTWRRWDPRKKQVLSKVKT
jgi:hypothetical protein